MKKETKRIKKVNFHFTPEYDEFLHLVQQPAMKKLWDNPSDAIWDKMYAKKAKER